MNKITIYDTTLRDGSQAEELYLSTRDKILIAQNLDMLGVDYIEGGWPSSNETDTEFFSEIKNYNISHAKITAFGSTHNPKKTAENDDNLKSLIASKADAFTIFGKTWDLHVTEALEISFEKNLEIIYNSIAFLKTHALEVFFDAEHFFDGFKQNKEYALSCIEKAAHAGANALILCDTYGGTLPHEIAEIVSCVKTFLPDSVLGIHTHNDCDLAVANALAAVENGASHIQGTINGYGERCGNANLCSLIPLIELKTENETIGKENLKKLTQVSRFVSDVVNISPFNRQAFVGASAFAHKGGIHVSAVLKNSVSYEHISPQLVGNKQRILLSQLAGRSNIISKAKEYGYTLDKNDPIITQLLEELKMREIKGYDYSAAEASFELLFFKTIGWAKEYFKLINYRVFDSVDKDNNLLSEATVILEILGTITHTAATGDGPVNALDAALRKGLSERYPVVRAIKLLDYKVRILNQTTASQVRVLIESGDSHSKWTTVGVSYNIINASWNALIDSFYNKLFKEDFKNYIKKQINN